MAAALRRPGGGGPTLAATPSVLGRRISFGGAKNAAPASRGRWRGRDLACSAPDTVCGRLRFDGPLVVGCGDGVLSLVAGSGGGGHVAALGDGDGVDCCDESPDAEMEAPSRLAPGEPFSSSD